MEDPHPSTADFFPAQRQQTTAASVGPETEPYGELPSQFNAPFNRTPASPRSVAPFGKSRSFRSTEVMEQMKYFLMPHPIL